MQQKKYVIGLIMAAVLVGLFFVQTKTLAKQNLEKARANLGRHLFYDTKLSYNLTKSCVSCHDPSMAFTDGYRTSAGADGFNVNHNAISLLNAKYKTTYTWKNPAITSLKMQLQFPFFNHDPKELGWKGNEQVILERFSSDPNYQQLFKIAFPGQKKPINTNNIQQAIVLFEEQLVSFNAPYDQYLQGNQLAMNQEAVVGMKLFHTAKLSCANCHTWEKPFTKFDTKYHEGIRVPSLRNIMLTAPYMHDGSIENIVDLLHHYEKKQSIQLTKSEQHALIAFFNALTDTSYLRNKELLNPFQYQ